MEFDAGLADVEGRARRADLLHDERSRRGLTDLDTSQWNLLGPLLACDAPSTRLRQAPRVASWLSRTPHLDSPRPAESFRTELLSRTRLIATDDGALFDRILRRYRHREMARIALRDLTRRARMEEVVRELSNLADALLTAAIHFHDRALGTPGEAGRGFCVLAMGKHGAEELNYSSDIDVMFVVDDGGHERERAVQLARRIMRSLSTVTEDGFAFRVDANLRPYGRDGALVLGLDEYEQYYERAGRTWERAALIKARPCAGDLAVGAELLDRLRPFVFRRSLDLGAVEAVAQMKTQIDRSLDASLGDDIKLGPGGIREIEFFVQALQLLHGGRQPRLRVRSTLQALDALLFAGLIGVRDRDELAAAYVFLRDVEHRIQLPQDEQLHALPTAGSPAATALARRMGFADEAAFLAVLAAHRARVHDRFSRLLATAADRPHPTSAAETALASLGENGAPDESLARLGFTDPESARGWLRRLSRFSDGPFGPRAREKHPGLAERLVDVMSHSPAPDLALSRFAQLTPPQWDPAALSTLLSTNPAIARILMLLFSTSDTLSADFQRHPELLDVLVRSDAAVLEKPLERFGSELSSRLTGLDPESALGALRSFRHEEMLRIGLHDLAGRLDADSVRRQLSSLAEALMSEALRLAREEIGRRYGEPPRARLAIIGLGSFGGRELDYESDLDLVFLHDAEGTSTGGERGGLDAEDWAARVCQRLVSHLTLPMAEGILYRVDTRLRPSGSSGPLVTSLQAFAGYHLDAGAHKRSAALWERQALLRARFIAGDRELGEQVDRQVLDVVAAASPPDDSSAQIADMRGRLEKPLAYGIDPKKGPGGLVDIEFAVQSLLITHRLRAASTLDAIEMLRLAKGVTDAVADEWDESWRFFRRVESRLRLMYGRSEVFVSREGPGLVRLARQLGDAAPDGGARLLRDLNRHMTRTRGHFERLVGKVPASGEGA